MFRSGYCFNLTPKFGEKVGSLYFEGGSWPCNGGSAAFSDRMFVQLDYPFKAQIIEQTKSYIKINIYCYFTKSKNIPSLIRHYMAE